MAKNIINLIKRAKYDISPTDSDKNFSKLIEIAALSSSDEEFVSICMELLIQPHLSFNKQKVIINLLKNAAKNNNIMANKKLAHIYMHGHFGVPVDLSFSQQCIERCLKNKDQSMLIEYLDILLVKNKPTAKIARFVKKVKDYFINNIVDMTFDRQLYYFNITTKAAFLCRNPNEIFLHKVSLPVLSDIEKEYHEKGFPVLYQATEYLGLLYLQGSWGVEKSLIKSFELLYLYTEQKDFDFNIYLAEIYINGRKYFDIKPNKEKAAFWLKIASFHNTDAFFLLSQLSRWFHDDTKAKFEYSVDEIAWLEKGMNENCMACLLTLAKVAHSQNNEHQLYRYLSKLKLLSIDLYKEFSEYLKSKEDDAICYNRGWLRKQLKPFNHDITNEIDNSHHSFALLAKLATSNNQEAKFLYGVKLFHLAQHMHIMHPEQLDDLIPLFQAAINNLEPKANEGYRPAKYYLIKIYNYLAEKTSKHSLANSYRSLAKKWRSLI